MECSLLFCRLRFLTLWLFLWHGFFDVVGLAHKNAVSLSLWLSSVVVFFANLKAVKKGSFVCFSSTQLAFGR